MEQATAALDDASDAVGRWLAQMQAAAGALDSASFMSGLKATNLLLNCVARLTSASAASENGALPAQRQIASLSVAASATAQLATLAQTDGSSATAERLIRSLVFKCAERIFGALASDGLAAALSSEDYVKALGLVCQLAPAVTVPSPPTSAAATTVDSAAATAVIGAYCASLGTTCNTALLLFNAFGQLLLGCKGEGYHLCAPQTGPPTDPAFPAQALTAHPEPFARYHTPEAVAARKQAAVALFSLMSGVVFTAARTACDLARQTSAAGLDDASSQLQSSAASLVGLCLSGPLSLEAMFPYTPSLVNECWKCVGLVTSAVGDECTAAGAATAAASTSYSGGASQLVPAPSFSISAALVQATVTGTTGAPHLSEVLCRLIRRIAWVSEAFVPRGAATPHLTPAGHASCFDVTAFDAAASGGGQGGAITNRLLAAVANCNCSGSKADATSGTAVSAAFAAEKLELARRMMLICLNKLAPLLRLHEGASALFQPCPCTLCRNSDGDVSGASINISTATRPVALLGPLVRGLSYVTMLPSLPPVCAVVPASSSNVGGDSGAQMAAVEVSQHPTLGRLQDEVALQLQWLFVSLMLGRHIPSAEDKVALLASLLSGGGVSSSGCNSSGASNFSSNGNGSGLRTPQALGSLSAFRLLVRALSQAIRQLASSGSSSTDDDAVTSIEISIASPRQLTVSVSLESVRACLAALTSMLPVSIPTSAAKSGSAVNGSAGIVQWLPALLTSLEADIRSEHGLEMLTSAATTASKAAGGGETSAGGADADVMVVEEEVDVDGGAGGASTRLDKRPAVTGIGRLKPLTSPVSWIAHEVAMLLQCMSAAPPLAAAAAETCSSDGNEAIVQADPCAIVISLLAHSPSGLGIAISFSTSSDKGGGDDYAHSQLSWRVGCAAAAACITSQQPTRAAGPGSASFGSTSSGSGLRWIGRLLPALVECALQAGGADVRSGLAAAVATLLPVAVRASDGGGGGELGGGADSAAALLQRSIVTALAMIVPVTSPTALLSSSLTIDSASLWTQHLPRALSSLGHGDEGRDVPVASNSGSMGSSCGSDVSVIYSSSEALQSSLSGLAGRLGAAADAAAYVISAICTSAGASSNAAAAVLPQHHNLLCAACAILVAYAGSYRGLRSNDVTIAGGSSAASALAQAQQQEDKEGLLEYGLPPPVIGSLGCLRSVATAAASALELCLASQQVAAPAADATSTRAPTPANSSAAQLLCALGSRGALAASALATLSRLPSYGLLPSERVFNLLALMAADVQHAQLTQSSTSPLTAGDPPHAGSPTSGAGPTAATSASIGHASSSSSSSSSVLVTAPLLPPLCAFLAGLSDASLTGGVALYSGDSEGEKKDNANAYGFKILRSKPALQQLIGNLRALFAAAAASAGAIELSVQQRSLPPLSGGSDNSSTSSGNSTTSLAQLVRRASSACVAGMWPLMQKQVGTLL